MELEPIPVCHIEDPRNEEVTLCRLGIGNFSALGYDFFIFLQDSFGEDIPEDERCDICWRDEEKRTLLLLAEA